MSLQRLDVDGKPATVAFLSGFGGEFVSPDDAKLVIVRWDDGNVAYLRQSLDSAQGKALSGQYLSPTDPTDGSQSLRSAARVRETNVHKAADSHYAKIKNSVDFAFALARKKLPNRITKLSDAQPALDAMEAALMKVLPPVLEQTLIAGGEAGADMLASLLKAAELRDAAKPLRFSFNGKNPNVSEWAQKHAADLVSGITNASKDRIREALAASLDGELSDQDLHEEILNEIGDDARADTIARTESMKAANMGLRQSWEQAIDADLLSGNEQQVWIATDDERLCPICDDLDGETVDLDEEFPGGLDGPPAHPNCRCTVGLV